MINLNMSVSCCVHQCSSGPPSSGRILVLTLVGLLRFTSHFSNPVAIAITAIADVMDDFVPCVSNLVECPSLRLLTLIYCKEEEKKERKNRRKSQ